MHCEQADNLLIAAAYDELDGPEREQLDAHLARCPTCRQKLADLEATAALLAEGVEALGEPKLTPDRRAAMLVADIAEQARPANPAAEVANADPPPRVARKLRFPSLRWTRTSAAAVAAIVGIGALLMAIFLPSLQKASESGAVPQARTVRKEIGRGLKADAQKPGGSPPSGNLMTHVDVYEHDDSYWDLGGDEDAPADPVARLAQAQPRFNDFAGGRYAGAAIRNAPLAAGETTTDQPAPAKQAVTGDGGRSVGIATSIEDGVERTLDFNTQYRLFIDDTGDWARAPYPTGPVAGAANLETLHLSAGISGKKVDGHSKGNFGLTAAGEPTADQPVPAELEVAGARYFVTGLTEAPEAKVPGAASTEWGIAEQGQGEADGRREGEKSGPGLRIVNGVPVLGEIPYFSRFFGAPKTKLAETRSPGSVTDLGGFVGDPLNDSGDIPLPKFDWQGSSHEWNALAQNYRAKSDTAGALPGGGQSHADGSVEEIGVDVDMQVGTDDPDDDWSPLKVTQDDFSVAARRNTGITGSFGAAVGSTGLEDFVVGAVGGSGRSLDVADDPGVKSKQRPASPEIRRSTPAVALDLGDGEVEVDQSVDVRRAMREQERRKSETDEIKDQDGAKAGETAQMATDQQVQDLLQRASELRRKQDYGQAVELVDQALFLDPQNYAGQIMKEMIEDSKLYVQRQKLIRDRAYLISKHSVEEDSGPLPHTDLMTFPEEWPEVTVRRLDVAEESTPEAAQNRLIEEKLAEPIPADFENNTLSNVIEYLRNQTGLNVYVNWTQLEKAGVGQDHRVSLQLLNVPASQVLELVLKEASAGDELNPISYAVHEGIVKISTERELKRTSVTTGTYDMRDLLDSASDFSFPGEPSRGLGADDDDDNDDEEDTLIREDMVFSVLDMIRQVGRPEEWVEFGGDVSSVSELNGNLIIRTTPENHREIGRLLAMLRETTEEPEEETAFPEIKAPPPAPAAPVPASQPSRPEAEQELAPAATFRAGPVNPFVMTARDRFSTFALDVDTASYSLARSYIGKGYLPPAAAVRMEEFVNAFDYNYPTRSDRAFAVHSAAAPAPFGQGLVLLRVGVKGKVIGRDMRKAANLVFVVDTSGSMARADRLPLVQYGLKLLVAQLAPTDRVSLVTYGTEASLVLEATPGSPGTPGAERDQIVKAVDGLQCQGSTNLAKGLALGYQVAVKNFVPGQINRVILLSDGVANIGVTEADAILGHVESYRGHGITFTSVGFGGGSYNDVLLEKLANRGDGAYVFVDSPQEAKRVFHDEIIATLQTIALDAKIQVDFDPQRVRRYRLIGYENRAIADQDFRNDAIDAGEVGSGQSSTALYEVELLRTDRDSPADLGTVYVRYRDAETQRIEEISQRLTGDMVKRRTPANSPRFYLAACAAEFAEILRQSEHARGSKLDVVEQMLDEVCRQIPLDTRAGELLDLVKSAKGLPAAP